ncbi:MAG: DUF3568 family protein [Candidatus Methylomirabilota bacterium]
MRARWGGRQPGLLGVLMLLLPLLDGCSGTAAVLRGEHSQIHAGNYERVWSATQRTLDQMKIQIINTEKDALGGTITARRANDTSITLTLEPTGVDTTRVRIQIGAFGDRDASEAIQARIVSNLRTGK